MELDLLALDDSILDLMPGEVDNFDGANLDFAAALLEDDGEETVQQITVAYNPEAETTPKSQDYPELELGVGGLELGDSDSDLGDPRRGRVSLPGQLTPSRHLPAT